MSADQMKSKTDRGWSPYVAGALVGVLAVVSALLTTVIGGKTNYLGASTTFVRFAGFILELFSAQGIEGNEYFKSTGIKVDWQFMVLVGIFIGALFSSLTDKSFRMESVPPLWEQHFGASLSKRVIAAFLGGIVAMIGARMADGCPSGHGLSGMMQLSVSSLVAMVMFFGAGIAVARLVYRGGAR